MTGASATRAARRTTTSRRPAASGRLSTDFQRNTVRAWAVYQLPLGLSVSGAYFYGSGNRFAIDRVRHAVREAGNESSEPRRADRRSRRAAAGSLRRPDVIATGAVAPRNALMGTPLHKVDLRVQEQIKLPGKARLNLVAELFNVFNHDNYGSFVTIINNSTLRTAAAEPEQRLRAALGPARFPSVVLR